MKNIRQLSRARHVDVKDYFFAHIDMLVVPFDVIRFHGVSWPGIQWSTASSILSRLIPFLVWHPMIFGLWVFECGSLLNVKLIIFNSKKSIFIFLTFKSYSWRYVIPEKDQTFGAGPPYLQVAIVNKATGPSQTISSNCGMEKFPTKKIFWVQEF